MSSDLVPITPRVWEGDPFTAGAVDSYGHRIEPSRALHVLCGRRFEDSAFTDARLRAIAAIGASFRDLRQVPTPERIVAVLGMLGWPTRGALRWVRDLMFADADDAAKGWR